MIYRHESWLLLLNSYSIIQLSLFFRLGWEDTYISTVINSSHLELGKPTYVTIIADILRYMKLRMQMVFISLTQFHFVIFCDLMEMRDPLSGLMLPFTNLNLTWCCGNLSTYLICSWDIFTVLKQIPISVSRGII